jgi:hypothetical protein
MLKTTVSNTKSSANAVTRRVTGIVSDVKEKLSLLSNSLENQVDNRRKSTACTLENTASALHRQGKHLSCITHSTADKLTATAKYLRKHRARNMMTDVGRLLKKNAAPSFAVFAALGFAGFLVTRTLKHN